MNEDKSKSECNDKCFFVDSIYLNDYEYEFIVKK